MRKEILVESIIKLQRIQIESSEFYLNKSVTWEPEQEIAISINTTFNKNDKNSISLSLDVSIFDEEFQTNNNPFFIRVVQNTYFEINDELDEESLIGKFGANMILLSFPYVRTFVTNLTAMTGIPPINIPVISIEDLLGK